MTDAPPIADASPPADSADALWGASGGLTRVEPAYRWVMTLRAALVAAGLLIAAGVAEVVLAQQELLQHGVIIGPAALIALYLTIALPGRRWHWLGYDMGEDRLRVARGYLWRTDTFVPFGRIQHIDVDQGVLARGFDLATLVVHTAGTHNSTVSLPGLAVADAAAMRETIRAHIKRETM